MCFNIMTNVYEEFAFCIILSLFCECSTDFDFTYILLKIVQHLFLLD